LYNVAQVRDFWAIWGTRGLFSGNCVHRPPNETILPGLTALLSTLAHILVAMPHKASVYCLDLFLQAFCRNGLASLRRRVICQQQLHNLFLSYWTSVPGIFCLRAISVRESFVSTENAERIISYVPLIIVTRQHISANCSTISNILLYVRHKAFDTSHNQQTRLYACINPAIDRRPTPFSGRAAVESAYHGQSQRLHMRKHIIGRRLRFAFEEFAQRQICCFGPAWLVSPLIHNLTHLIFVPFRIGLAACT